MLSLIPLRFMCLHQVPHPDDGLTANNVSGKPERRHQLFLRSQGQISARLLTKEGGEGDDAKFKSVGLSAEELDPSCYEKRPPPSAATSTLLQNSQEKKASSPAVGGGSEFWPSGIRDDPDVPAWIQFWDRQLDKAYYYDPKTGRVQWEKPKVPTISRRASSSSSSSSSVGGHGGSSSSSSRSR